MIALKLRSVKMKRVDKIIQKVKDELEKENQNDRYLIGEFFNLLFWKDYGSGHVDVKDKGNIFKEIEEATKTYHDEGDESVRLDLEKILPFINKIRKQIGLMELSNTLFGGGTLMERTPEVDKHLILQELEKSNDPSEY